MCLEIAVLTIHSHLTSPPEAKNTIGDGETRGLNHLSFLHLPQIVVSRAIGVRYQQCLQCCPDLITQMGQGIPDEVDNTERKHALKINLPIFKDEDAKDAVTYQSWRWDLTMYRWAGCRDCTL